MNSFHSRLRLIAQVFVPAAAILVLQACDREKPAAKPDVAPAAAAPSEPGAVPSPAVPPAPVEGAISIKPNFPKPFGSPQAFRFAAKIPNLDANEPRPMPEEFSAPAGTTLVSEGKPVTAFTRPLQGSLAMVTDGDSSSYPDALLVLPGGGNWVQIDLGSSLAIQKVHLWHAHNLGAEVYTDLVVQVADDPEFATNPVTLYNADLDGSLGLGNGTDRAYIETYQGRLIDGKGQKGRYIRIWGSGSYTDKRLRFAEVQVYATP